MTESINFINFNQDASCISVGTTLGYKIFNCEPFGKCYSKELSSIGIIEMLYITSLIAIVGIGEQPHMSPRRLKILNTKKNQTICELTFPSIILNVKLNKERLVVILENQIYIYNIKSMKLLYTIETLPNPDGLVALSPIIENNYLAYPSPRAMGKNIFNNDINNSNNNNNNVNNDLQPPITTLNSRIGDVIIFNTKTLQPYCVIEAHKASLAAIALSNDGLLLASASIKGTIIRVFDVETGEKLYQFRRGTYGTKIFSLSFSNDNKFLTASSATETVHIFKLSDEFQINKRKNENRNEQPDSEDEDDEEDEEEEEEDFELDEEEMNERLDKVPPLINSPKKIAIIESDNSDNTKKIEPIIDQTRRSVGRLIRKSSQSLGRRAAETMGIYLPKRVSSVLKPIRHFASLKIPASNGNKSIVAMNHLHGIISDNLLNKLKITAPNLAKEIVNNRNVIKSFLEVIVVNSNGLFLKYILDGERGGDCILLSQYSLLDGIPEEEKESDEVEES